MGLFRKKDPRRETLRAAKRADRQNLEQNPEENPTPRKAKLDALIVERMATFNETHTRKSR